MLREARTLATLLTLHRRLHMSRAQLMSLQNRQLRRLVAHAYDQVPYYRRLFKQAGVTPRDIRCAADLRALPITSKADLQALGVEETLARAARSARLIVHFTSGSTGRPAFIRRTWFEERLLNGFRRRALCEFGLRPADRNALVLLPRGPHPNDFPGLQKLVESLRGRTSPRLNGLAPPELILRELRRLKPEAVTGLPSLLVNVAALIEGGEKLNFRPRFVTTGGEVLTPQVREQLRRAFAAPVCDTYGCHEFNLIAWECAASGDYHLCDDGVIVEVLHQGAPARPGERGEIIVTGLHSFAMPFIRFRLGDFVTQGAAACSCGRPFATIRSIDGRTVDEFALPGARRLSPYQLLMAILYRAPWIRQYQLVQERRDRIVLLAVPSATPSLKELAAVRAAVAELVGAAVEFEITLVSDLAPEPSGKTRVFRSLVSHDQAS